MPLGTLPPFSAVKAFFTGSDVFSDYRRGGPFVPNIPANAAISTTAEGLALTQFTGADKVTVQPLAVSANDVNVFQPEGATQANGSSFASATGGTGNYTYQWQLVSGVSCHTGSLTGAGINFRITFGTAEAIYRITVSDGVSTVSQDIWVYMSIGQPI